MHFPKLSKLNFRIPNPFRRREAGGGGAGATTSSLNVLRPPTRDGQGAESPVGWHTQDNRVLRLANPDGNVSPEHPQLMRIDTDVGDPPRIEIQSATTAGSPLSPTPSLTRRNVSAESLGDFNPQWVGHTGGPIVDAPPHGSLHIVNGSPSTSGSSSPESRRSASPEAHPSPAPAWTDGFDPRQFPPPGGFRPLERNSALRLNPSEAAERRQIALGRSIERPVAPGPDHPRNNPDEPQASSPHGSAVKRSQASTPARQAGSQVNYSRPFGPNNPFPGHRYDPEP